MAEPAASEQLFRALDYLLDERLSFLVNPDKNEGYSGLSLHVRQSKPFCGTLMTARNRWSK